MTLSLFSLANLLIGSSVVAAPFAQQEDTATVSFTALTCPSGLALEEAGSDACTEPRSGVTIDYDKVLIEVEHITVVTDEHGEGSIDIPDPANGARFDISLPNNVLYYTERPGPIPGYGVYLADCGQAGNDAGFYYSGLGISFDDLAAGDQIDCQLFFIPPVATSPVQLMSGSCDAITGVEANLNPLTLPYGEAAGADVRAPAQVSLSTIGISFDEATGTDHAIIVYNDDGSNTVLSCANIEGAVDENGSLAFALPAQGGSLYSGIGVIRPTDAGAVDIAVYVAADLDGSDRDVSGVTGTLTADAGSPAGVYAGTCDSGEEREAVSPLEPVAPVGDGVVEQSTTSTDLTLDELVAEDYGIAVFDEDTQDTALVCGAIGGILGVSEDLAPVTSMIVGLPALGDSLYSGIAVITVTDEGTADITIYLAPDLDGSGEAP